MLPVSLMFVYSCWSCFSLLVSSSSSLFLCWVLCFLSCDVWGLVLNSFSLFLSPFTPLPPSPPRLAFPIQKHRACYN